MRFVERVLLSRWIVALCGLAFMLVLPDPRPRAMEGRAGEPHAIVGVPRDVHTRVVAAAGNVPGAGLGTISRVRRQRPSSAISVHEGAHAAFEVTDESSEPLSPEARAAFDYAVEIWAGLINSPVTIHIRVGWGAHPSSLAFGSAAIYRNFPNAPLPDVWYSKPLADALAGVDVQPVAGGIQLRFNSSAPWYFGTDGRPPAGRYDFVTVALHEIAHHFGFVPLMWGDGGWGLWGVLDDPAIYSRHVVNGAGQSLLNTARFPNPSTTLGAELASNNLFWSGPAAIAALGGVRPKLYAPNPWTNEYGTSLNHLDEAAYPPGNPNSLMTPLINTAEAIHVPGPAVMGMLADMGWVQDASCSYALDDPDVLVERETVTGIVVNVLAPALCQWTAVSNDPGFITVTGGATSNGPSPVTFSVSANAGVYRTGTMTIAGRTFTVRQNGSAPTMTVDKSALRFGAASLGGTFAAQTQAQIVRLRQSGLPGTVTWTAQSSQPWLHVTPASGTGSADLSISVVPAPGVPLSGNVSGAIHFSFGGAGTFAGPIAVALTTVQNGLTTPPFGYVDTPADMQTGATGAIAMTGWALDDLEIDRVAICRLPLPFEQSGVGPNAHCGGRADIFVGFAVRVEGARPDVQSSFPGFPLNTKAGWGFMILTNMLPLEGNSTYTFLVWAFDREGLATRLGVRTISCANAAATRPFGAIDTPEQGGTASGGAYVNFGWALTPQPKTIPVDGSTITVLVDGSPIGNATYANYRADIAGLFPGRNNSDGAVGYRIIDTALLENGLHTISWTVTDDQGATEGIGSRFFTVSNGAGAMTASAAPVTAAAAASVAAVTDRTAILGRRGFDLSTPWTSYAVGTDGRALVRGEELDRFELALGLRTGERLTGFLRLGDDLAPLPAGSQLDPATGAFTWAPGVGFVGTYDLVFVRARHERVVARQNVRIVLHPKGSGRVGPQIAIDAPRAQQDVAQPFAIGGWAADVDAAEGTGIASVHVWAYPLTGGPPVFLGSALYGAARPDVAAVHGARFRDSGFGLVVQGLRHGNYDLAVFAWSTEKGDFAPAKVVRLTIR